MPSVIIAMAVVAGIQSGLALAQEEELDVLFACSEVDAVDRFRLCNVCRPMQLLVESLPDDAKAIGLTRKHLQDAAESRLRAARLYTEDYFKAHGALLYVNANVAGPVFGLSVEYNKELRDSVTGKTWRAMIWDTASIGTHGRDSGFIVQSLSRKLDAFLVEYLRVNEKHCPRSPPPPPPPKKKDPIRVEGNVQASRLVHRVEPEYPELAKRARVSGMIILQVIVSEGGTVQEVKIVRGHPLLNDAATRAVRQWRYSPYLLNGEPIPVITTVTVDFVLR